MKMHAYRRGDELGIVPVTPKEIDASIVHRVPCDDGAKHVDREADVRLAHLQGYDVETCSHERLSRRCSLAERRATAEASCKGLFRV